MSSRVEPEIILYDLACTKNVCFSPAVWRVRLMLNYKKIPYKTVFLEFPDIAPTLKGLGIAPSENNSTNSASYTVPAIYHTPTNKYIMDSTPIAQFLATTYPEPLAPLTSELGEEIATKARAVVGVAFRHSVVPREVHILSPRAEEYFRRTREPLFKCKLEELIEGEKEEKAWQAADSDIRAVGELMLTNKAEGPFIMGANPSGTDFFIAGAMQSARLVHKPVFARLMSYPGYKEIYKACLPWMEKQD